MFFFFFLQFYALLVLRLLCVIRDKICLVVERKRIKRNVRHFFMLPICFSRDVILLIYTVYFSFEFHSAMIYLKLASIECVFIVTVVVVVVYIIF